MLCKRHRTWTLSLGLLSAGLVVSCTLGLLNPAPALATTSSGFSTVSTIGPTLFDEIDVKTHADTFKVRIDTKGFSDVYIVTNKVTAPSATAPGGNSGWHSHPGPSLVTVLSGTATYYDGDDPACTPHMVPAGGGFVDQGGSHVHLVRNEGNVDLVLIAFQIIPQGAQRRIDVSTSPGNCPF
jgi:mannose-6-phosphate isomerase-like protein (cupin superfamily)